MNRSDELGSFERADVSPSEPEQLQHLSVSPQQPRSDFRFRRRGKPGLVAGPLRAGTAWLPVFPQPHPGRTRRFLGKHKKE